MEAEQEEITLELVLEKQHDSHYWLSRPPRDRWIALQLLREMVYGKEAANAPLRRDVWEIRRLGEDN